MTTVVVPDSMTRFRCNQRGCCCKGWRITFEPEEVIALSRVFPPERRGSIVRGARLFVDDDGLVDGMQLRTVGPERACQFLAPDGRCGVHAEGHADALPGLCHRFPAFPFRDDLGRVELHFDATCPEVLEQLAERDAPLEVIEVVDPAPDDHLALRSSEAASMPPTAIGDRALSSAEMRRIRSCAVAYVNAPEQADQSALTLLARVSHAFARLGNGEALEAFGVRAESEAGHRSFDAFFDASVQAHDAGVLGRTFMHYRRFIFTLDLDDAAFDALVPLLTASASWRDELRPTSQADLQPFLRRWLAHRLFAAYDLSRATGQLAFTYSQITHVLAASFRYQLGLQRLLGRPVDLTMAKLAIGGAEYLHRNLRMPASAMPWFGIEGGAGVPRSLTPPEDAPTPAT